MHISTTYICSKFLKIIAFLVLCLLNSFAQGRNSLEKIHIQVGESYLIDVPDQADIILSRKGIIELDYMGSNKWKIFGVRGGTVFVKAQIYKKNLPVRWMIQVSSDKDKMTDRNALENSLPKEKKNYIIQLKVIEQNKKNGTLSKFGNSIDASGSSSGFDLDWAIFLKNENTTQESQLIGEPFLKIQEGAEGHVQLGGEFLSSHVSYRKTSEPDEKTEIRHWKQHGLQLSVKIDRSLKKNTSILSYSLNLKSPGNQSYDGGSSHINSLSSQEARGVVELPLNSTKLVAKLYLNSKNFDSRDRPLLSQLPIVGPIFKNFEKSNLGTSLLIWATLREYDP